MPLGLPSAVWSSLSGLHWSQLSNAVKSTRRACLPESLTQSHLAGWPQPTSTSHGLRFPTALTASKVRFTRALPPPATFRLQGLATLVTVYSLRGLASLISYRQRSWDSPFGAFSSRVVTGRFRLGRTHVSFTHRYTLASEDSGAGSTSCDFWALTHPASPWRPDVGLGRRPLVAPLGFSLPGFRSEAWVRISPDLRSRASSMGLAPHRRRLSVSISFCFVSSVRSARPFGVGRETLIGFLHRVDPMHSNSRSSRAMSSPRIRCRITADQSDTLWGTANPTGVVRINWRC
jgi:hypothetical protein